GTVHRNRNCRLRFGGAAAETLFSTCGRSGTRDHDGAHHYAHDGGDAAAGPQYAARSRLWPRNTALAHHVLDYVANGYFRRHHRGDAGVCARSRRNGPAAVHGIREPVLELAVGSANGGIALADFHLCDFSL